MPIIFGKKIENKIEVGSVAYQLSESKDGYKVDSIPEYPAQKKVGIDFVMIYDLDTKKFNFEERERELNEEEKLEKRLKEIEKEIKVIKEKI